MLPYFEQDTIDLRVCHTKTFIFPLHLQQSVELVYCESGIATILIDNQIYQICEGDIAVIFPNTVHSYLSAENRRPETQNRIRIAQGGKPEEQGTTTEAQSTKPEEQGTTTEAQSAKPEEQDTTTEAQADFSAILLISSLKYCGSYIKSLTEFRPTTPILSSPFVHQDVPYCIHGLHKELHKEHNNAHNNAYNNAHNEEAHNNAHNGEHSKELHAQQSGLLLESYCHAYMGLLLARVIPHLSLQANNPSRQSDLTSKLMAYIQSHFQESLSLDILAQKLNISKYYLSHIFSQKLHTAFPDYLNEFRLNHALNMIYSGADNITEIWGDSGFESQRTFHRVFKKKTGMTPTDYMRRTHTKK